MKNAVLRTALKKIPKRLLLAIDDFNNADCAIRFNNLFWIVQITANWLQLQPFHVFYDFKVSFFFKLDHPKPLNLCFTTH
jgi:hypothetical protein